MSIHCTHMTPQVSFIKHHRQQPEPGAPEPKLTSERRNDSHCRTETYFNPSALMAAVIGSL